MDAISRALGESITFHAAGWASLVTQCKQQYGTSIHDAKLPSPSYHVAFEDSHHDGSIEAGSSAHVVSIAGEKTQSGANLNTRSKWECTYLLAHDSDEEEVHVIDAY